MNRLLFVRVRDPENAPCFPSPGDTDETRASKVSYEVAAIDLWLTPTKMAYIYVSRKYAPKVWIILLSRTPQEHQWMEFTVLDGVEFV